MELTRFRGRCSPFGERGVHGAQEPHAVPPEFRQRMIGLVRSGSPDELMAPTNPGRFMRAVEAIRENVCGRPRRRTQRPEAASSVAQEVGSLRDRRLLHRRLLLCAGIDDDVVDLERRHHHYDAGTGPRNRAVDERRATPARRINCRRPPRSGGCCTAPVSKSSRGWPGTSLPRSERSPRSGSRWPPTSGDTQNRPLMDT